MVEIMNVCKEAEVHKCVVVVRQLFSLTVR